MPLRDADGPFPVLPVKDLSAAPAFYGDILGLRLVADKGQVQLWQSGTFRLLLSWNSEAKPSGGTVAGWSVRDIRATVDQLRGAGVAFDTYGFPHDDMVVTLGDDKVAWFKDPDGNVLSLTQFA